MITYITAFIIVSITAFICKMITKVPGK